MAAFDHKWEYKEEQAWLVIMIIIRDVVVKLYVKGDGEEIYSNL